MASTRTLKTHVKTAKTLAKTNTTPPRRPIDPILRIASTDLITTITHRVSGEDDLVYAWFKCMDGDLETPAVSIGVLTSPEGDLEVISFMTIKRILTDTPLELILERQNRKDDWVKCDGAFIPDTELWNRVCELRDPPSWLKNATDFRSFMVEMEMEWRRLHPLPSAYVEKDMISLMEKSHAITTPYYESVEKVAAAVQSKAAEILSDEENVIPIESEEEEEEEEDDDDPTPDDKRKKKKDKKHKKDKRKEKPEVKESSSKRIKIAKTVSPPPIAAAPIKPEPQKKTTPPPPALGSFEESFTRPYNYTYVTAKLTETSRTHKSKIVILSAEEVVNYLSSTERSVKCRQSLIFFLCILEAISMGKDRPTKLPMKLPGLNNVEFSTTYDVATTAELVQCIAKFSAEIQLLEAGVVRRWEEERNFFAKIVQASSQYNMVTCLRNIHQHAILKFNWLMYIVASALGFPSESEISQFIEEEELYPEIRGIYRSLEKQKG